MTGAKIEPERRGGSVRIIGSTIRVPPGFRLVGRGRALIQENESAVWSAPTHAAIWLRERNPNLVRMC